MPKFSIVMPILADNLSAEHHILSVLKQSFEDFELWLIDGGGNEKNTDICFKYSKQDKRIKLICPNHKILELTIKHLINTAKGEIVTVLKGVIHCKYLEYLLENLHDLELEYANKCNNLEVFNTTGCLVFLGNNISNAVKEIEKNIATKIASKAKKSLQHFFLFNLKIGIKHEKKS